jgi:hypothetical protein
MSRVTQILRHRSTALGQNVGDSDSCPFGDEESRRHLTRAARRAADDRYLAFEASHVTRLRLA